MDDFWQKIKNFKSTDFDSPDEIGSGFKMKQSTIEKLQIARNIAGIPFKINSGYRTIAYNSKIGGKPNSAHLRGHAVDISCNDSALRYKIILALLAAGFKRLGIHNSFIHADDDSSLPNEVLFLY